MSANPLAPLVSVKRGSQVGFQQAMRRDGLLLEHRQVDGNPQAADVAFPESSSRRAFLRPPDFPGIVIDSHTFRKTIRERFPAADFPGIASTATVKSGSYRELGIGWGQLCGIGFCIWIT